MKSVLAFFLQKNALLMAALTQIFMIDIHNYLLLNVINAFNTNLLRIESYMELNG